MLATSILYEVDAETATAYIINIGHLLNLLSIRG
jgi:hypothetical protein